MEDWDSNDIEPEQTATVGAYDHVITLMQNPTPVLLEIIKIVRFILSAIVTPV